MPTRAARLVPTLALAVATLPGLATREGAAVEPGKPEIPPAERRVTFNKDIAPLVYRRCASCHRPGEVAPFPLLSFRDVSKRAELIRTVTEERTMPPWKAVPGSGHFVDERRMTDVEVATIARWVREGAPEGDPADLPPPPKFTDGWRLGEPDMIVKMPDPYTLVAEGPDVYRCFVIPLKVPAGKYLKAVEYRPGNRRIVHHAVHTMLPHDIAKRRLEGGDGKSFGSGLAPPGQLLPGQLAFWTPGMEPRPLPEGYAAEWPEGVDLVLQLHLHPAGKPETEQSSIGLHFTDQKPRGRLRLMLMSNNKIDIPAGEANHVVNTSLTLRSPTDLYGVFPHMHLIGRSVKVTATLPDGTRTPVIAIDDWDFNWQHYYEYARPLQLPAGTRLEGRWTFDNSDANPANPNHPPQRVSYGEQTANEMAILVMDAIPTGPPANASGGRSPVEIARRARNAFRSADKDGNGKLGVDEVLAAVGDREPADMVRQRFAECDRDGDKQLDLVELTEALRLFGRR